MDYEENEKGSIRPDGIVMIVLASIGILIVVTTITCLFVTSKKRNRVESRLESATNRNLSTARTARSRSRDVEQGSPPAAHVGTILPMFPEFQNELGKFPPSYDEALRLPTPTTPNAPPLSPRGIPPPAFDEITTNEQCSSSSTDVVASASQVTGTVVSSGNPVKVNTTEPCPVDLVPGAENHSNPTVLSESPEFHE